MKKSGKDAQGAGGVEIKVSGKNRIFNIDDPKLPDWVADREIAGGDYPYPDKLKRKEYEATLETLQVELVKLQAWLQATGERAIVVFEGRDAAGKGGAIKAWREYLNPRNARVVALPKPTDAERGQWYFQRYIAHFPTSGEFVAFDRSWYNRAGVEPVMGFCTPEQHQKFLDDVPQFELSIVNEGIRFFKFWLDIAQETQLGRFHDRRHSKLTSWKFSPIDIAGIAKWNDYSEKRDLMLERTDAPYAPWAVVRANDKRRARIAILRRLLLSMPYAGRAEGAIGGEDSKIIRSAPDFLAGR